MRHLILLCFVLLNTFAAFGKQPGSPFVVEHIGLKDGLSNNFVSDITQDKHGFIWIATDGGLNRFDGENFKVFSEKNTELKGNSVNALFYDARTDRLWVGSKKGLNVLDCKSQKFLSVSLPPDIKSPNIVDVSQASDGGIYVLNHYDFLLHYDIVKEAFRVYKRDDFPGLPMSFKSIADDGHGNLYIGHVNYGFSVVNLKTKKVENYRNKPGDPKSVPGNNVLEIFIDRFNNIWLGTDKGLALFNPISKDFSTFGGNDKDAGSGANRNVYSITESKNGLLWIGSDIGGVSILDIRDLSLSNPGRLKFTSLPASGDRNGISSVNVRCAFQDSFGNMWIGNFSDGLDFISHAQPKFNMLPYTVLGVGNSRDKPVWSVFHDKDDRIYVGSENEIALFSSGRLERLYNLSGYLETPGGRVVAMAKVGETILFSVYEEGVFSLDPGSGAIRRITSSDSTNSANSIVVLGDGSVLLGMNRGGLFKYSDGRLTKLEEMSKVFNNLIPNGIITDRHGQLWIGTYGDGIFIFDKNQKLKYHLDSAHGLASNAVIQLYSDSRGCIWSAGYDGLSLIKDPSRPQSVINYCYDSGLNDIHIRAIQEDSEGNMWFSTNNGISKWDRKNAKIENYDYHDGLPHSSFTDRAACASSGGDVYFGSLNGICHFLPEQFPATEEKIPVRIVECQSIITPKGVPSSDLIQPDDNGVIKVPYDMNSLRIVFSVPDYSQSRVVEYAYMVEGLDEDWIMAGREHEAVLRNLSPGKYIFKVRARLRNQNWNDANVSTLRIIVTPPLWLTWYAKTFYIIAIAVIIYVIVRVYKHRLLLKSSLEMERRKSIDEQQLNNERLRFYTNITHELRTPLTLILGPLEDLVADKQYPETYKKRIRTIHASALRLLNLINQILEFRKTETQNRKLTVSKGDITSVVREIGLRYKELNHNDKVSITIRMESPVPEIYFDSDIIHTILNNLLSNAVKYTPEGSINLIMKYVKNEDGAFVEISVSDTGYGIDDKALPHIFDRYYQAEGKHQASGTGIGLSLVRALSDLHEGSLSVESKVGKGTVFTFRLNADNTYPDALHKESEAETLQEAKNVESVADEGIERQPVVLVVEDNDDIRDYIESSLKSKYQVLTAVNGQEGVDFAKKHIPDVIISDIMMPVMDGMELCKIVKEDISTSHIPVILLTAKDSLRDKEAGYEIGADSYLTKPFSAKLLISRIRNILESRKRLASIISATVKGNDIKPVDNIDNNDTEENNNVEPSALKLSRIDEEFIQKFTRIVEENMTLQELDINYLQRSLNMSAATLYRKLKGLTGMSANEFIRKIRLRHGYELLKDGCNVSEAAYSCGFNDVGYFRNRFKEEYGISPSQFIKQQRT